VWANLKRKVVGAKHRINRPLITGWAVLAVRAVEGNWYYARRTGWRNSGKWSGLGAAGAQSNPHVERGAPVEMFRHRGALLYVDEHDNVVRAPRT